MPSIISVENLSKSYLVGHQSGSSERYTALRDVLSRSAKNFVRKSLDMLRGRQIIQGDEIEEFWALRDVSFVIEPGEVVGIIGSNGAGKSTLLKVLSRITEPTQGRVVLHGRVASLLEVGTGFHPELSGRENIFLNGAILGMSNSEIRRKFDEIVAFAEVERFLDTPVKRYSSGMYVRLAFSVAAHLDPEILVVDEVLAVGDARFQKKCLGKMKDISQNQGRTVLFVSHNMAAIKTLCCRAISLHRGQVRLQGGVRDVVEDYLADHSREMSGEKIKYPLRDDAPAQVIESWIASEKGLLKNNFSCDEDVFLRFQLVVRKPIPGLYGYLELSTSDGTVLVVSDSFDVQQNPLDCLQPGLHDFSIKIPRRILGHGTYRAYLNLTSELADSFQVDCPGIIGVFSMYDESSKRGNQRGGFLSLQPCWSKL